MLILVNLHHCSTASMVMETNYKSKTVGRQYTLIMHQVHAHANITKILTCSSGANQLVDFSARINRKVCALWLTVWFSPTVLYLKRFFLHEEGKNTKEASTRKRVLQALGFGRLFKGLTISRDKGFSTLTRENNFVAQELAHLGIAHSLGCHILYFLYFSYLFIFFGKKDEILLINSPQLQRTGSFGTQNVNGATLGSPKQTQPQTTYRSGQTS